MTAKKILYLLPILLFTGMMIVALMLHVLPDRPADLQSFGPGSPAPLFTRAEFGSENLKDRVTIVNFFASWCPPCEAEHPLLIDLKSHHGLTIYGVNYKDGDSGRVDYLQRLGNPYAAVTADPKGGLAAIWGVRGVPETFVIDKNGIIRYRINAPLTPDVIDNTLIPLIRRLQ